MIGELYQTDPDAKNANPANIWRQKQILDALKSSLHTNKHRSGWNKRCGGLIEMIGS